MYRIGVAGTGFIAVHKHLPAWRTMGRRAKVVALCDTDPARRQQVAKRFEIPRAYTNVAEMLEHERLDVLDICTPPRSHVSLAVEGMEAGSHVLIEKPMAVSMDECDLIIQTADRTGRRVCVAHSDLFYPAFMRATEIVKNGAIGTFTGMHIFLATPVDYITSQPEHWAHKLPGGVVGETGPHAVYLTLAFINPICDVRVHAQKSLKEFPWSSYEQYHLTFVGERAVSSAVLTYTTNQWAARVDIWGTQGLLRVDLESQSVIRYRRGSLRPWNVGFSALSEALQILAGATASGLGFLAKRFQCTHETLFCAFLESLRNGSEPPVPAQQGREAVWVMNRIAKMLEAQPTMAKVPME